MKQKLLLFSLCLFAGINASAYDAYVNGIYYDLSGNSAIVTYGDTKYAGEITIPESVTYENNTYAVTSIGDEAFRECGSLSSVIIPIGVTSISYDAFRDCRSLISVTIPEGVTSIYGGAFGGCRSLTSITIPNSVTGIGEAAFSGCSSLTSITIPDNVTGIGERAFRDCSGLISVTIGNGVTDIGYYVFQNCTSLTSVIIGNSVTGISNYSFEKCSSLVSVTLPESLTEIGIRAFALCSKLTSIIIPENVVKIGSAAFEGCALKHIYVKMKVPAAINSNTFSSYQSAVLHVPFGCGNAYRQADNWKKFIYIIEFKPEVDGICYNLNKETMVAEVTKPNFDYSGDIVIPSTITYEDVTYAVTSIGQFAFIECSGLTSITIPESVTSIGIAAFEVCSGLTSVTIGSGVTSIGESAFYSCSGLIDVYCYAENVPNTDTSAFIMSSIENATLHVPGASLEEYKATKPWSSFGNFMAITTEPEAIAEETTVNPAETATPGAATTNDGVTTSLGIDDEVNVEEGSVTLHTAMTTEEVSQLVESVEPGSSAFTESFKGICFQLAAGKGKIELVIETLGDYALGVMKGTELLGEFTTTEKGTISIPYDLTEDTWFYLFPTTATKSSARRRAEAAAEGLKIYTVSIVPGGSEPIIKGDLNGDSKIDIADAVSVLDLMAEGKDNPAADLNGDGKVDIADFVSVLDLMAAQ